MITNRNKYLVFPLVGFFTSINVYCQQTERPNIILILTDDQGYGDFGFTGNPNIKTPVLDELASKSVNFNQFYVSPVCAPTRASIMTGKFSLRTGIYDTYNGGAMMATEEITIAEILKENGYRTGIFGKWHLGDNYPMRPHDQGFDFSLVHLSGGIGQPGDYLNYFRSDSSYFDPTLLENGVQTPTKGYCSDVYTDYLIDFIKKNSDTPFFTYLAFNAPHTPLQLPQKYYDIYAGLKIDSAEYPKKGRDFPEISGDNLESAKRVYGMVTNIDYNIGRILSTLKKQKIDKNTLIIFLTDNGPEQWRYNGGLRQKKGSAYDGGIKVPCIMHYPGKFDPKISVDIPSAHIDLLPTILDLCKINQPFGIDGKSLLPLIQGQSVDWADSRALYFHFQRGYPELYQNISIRKGDYKLVGNTDHLATIEKFDLFNLKNDPSELNNIVKKSPNIALDLKHTLDTWYNKVIVSKNLISPPLIEIGSYYENPVVLNRNDAKGSPNMWDQDNVYTYWDIDVLEEGLYDINIHFINDLPANGKLVLKIGTIQKTTTNTNHKNKLLSVKSMSLKKGPCRLESWYLSKEAQIIAPFIVEITKL